MIHQTKFKYTVVKLLIYNITIRSLYVMNVIL